MPLQVAVEVPYGAKDVDAVFTEISAGFTLVPFEEHIARIAARLQQAAIRGKRLAPWSDIQVAATARHLGTYVITRNPGDFVGLDVETWDFAGEAGTQ